MSNQGRKLWLPAFGSALLLWMAFPPLQLWPLAWIAPIGWLRIISQTQLAGRRPYVVIFLAGFAHWLVMVQWVRLPHWTAAIGWFFLAAYLAAYVPAFVAISRVVVHRWKWSSVCAAPIVWVGMEVLRGYLFTGFSLLLLGHSQVQVPHVIQWADIAGAYGVSFVIMLVAASLERLVPAPDRARIVVTPLAVSIVALLVTLAYGSFRLTQVTAADDKTLKVSLIQGSFDTDFSGSLESSRDAFLDYVRLTAQAAKQFPDADLVIWPESMFTGNSPCLTYDTPLQLIPDWDGSLADLKVHLDDTAEHTRDKARWVSRQAGGATALVGTSWNHLRGTEVDRYNSAVLIQPGGQIAERYDKMHPVMFGEYLPLGDVIPWLYTLSPMGAGLTAGTEPKSLAINGVRVAPNICFENTVPQLIRRQVRQLSAAGQEPDILITITNDGWFWGSSLLDVHMACGVFRAIEMRRPLLIAANTGFSAHIDAQGRVVQRGPRRAEGIVTATVQANPRNTLYLAIGDSLAGVCLVISLLAAATELRRRVKDRQHRSSSDRSETSSS